MDGADGESRPNGYVGLSGIEGRGSCSFTYAYFIILYTSHNAEEASLVFIHLYFYTFDFFQADGLCNGSIDLFLIYSSKATSEAA